MDPLTAYVHSSEPWLTDFGDGVFDGLVPPGWMPVVTRQPQYGTVTILSATGWRFSAPAVPAIVSGNLADSWEWQASDGAGNFGPTHTVAMELCGMG